MTDIMEKKTETKVPAIQPACSVCEDDGTVRLNIEMPGVSKDSVEIQVERNELLIIGRDTRVETEGKYLIRERRVGEFRKRFIIDESVDRERIDASVVNGILTLTLHIKEAAKPRKIEIK